jgi:hypothetical protein
MVSHISFKNIFVSQDPKLDPCGTPDYKKYEDEEVSETNNSGNNTVMKFPVP